MLNPETVSRTVPRVRSARSLSLLFLRFSPLPLPLLSRSDSHEREREELSPFSSSLRDGSNPLAFFSRVYFSRIPKTKERRNEGTFIRRSMTSENTFGGNESDSNPSCISGRVR